jgi:copper chaperone NosL
MKIHRMRLFFALFLAMTSLHCQKQQGTSTQPLTAIKLEGHACEACGMIVREQPIPRGQAIHRDGKRVFFCSLSDMLSYLQTPSPHGKAQAIYVEALEPSADPLPFATTLRPWIPAQEASFVLGVKKDRVMGTPLLSYASPADAQRWAKQHNAQALSWDALLPAWKKKQRHETSHLKTR